MNGSVMSLKFHDYLRRYQILYGCIAWIIVGEKVLLIVLHFPICFHYPNSFADTVQYNKVFQTHLKCNFKNILVSMCVRFDRSHSFPPKLMVLTHLRSAFDSHSAVMHSQRSCSCFLNRVFSAAAYLSHLDWHLTNEKIYHIYGLKDSLL